MLENAILLIGLGTNDYEQGRIIELNDLTKIKECYGIDSCFYSAVRTINQFADSPQLFLLNLNSWEQIEDIKEQLQLLQIDYIVPLNNFSFSQTLFDKLSEIQNNTIIEGRITSTLEDLKQQNLFYISRVKEFLNR